MFLEPDMSIQGYTRVARKGQTPLTFYVKNSFTEKYKY